MISSEQTTDVDRRGVRRGRCNNLSCLDCDNYETLEGRLESTCLYCGHVAPEHGEIQLPFRTLKPYWQP